MDDKVKLLELYEKMNRISINLSSLNEKISVFKDEFTKSLLVDNKIPYNDEINSSINNVNNLTDSVKYDIMNHIKDYI